MIDFIILVGFILFIVALILRIKSKDPNKNKQYGIMIIIGVVLWFGGALIDGEEPKTDDKKETVESSVDKTEEKKEDTSTKDEKKEEEKKQEYKLKHGELLDIKTDNNILIIKAKIKPSWNNKTTIDQNGYNVEDIILNQGGDKFNEIQYWAVADMSNGEEDKVISFTLNKEQINAVKNKQILGNEIVNKANDVWILPSLKN